jgi:hypothetical protein
VRVWRSQCRAGEISGSGQHKCKLKICDVATPKLQPASVPACHMTQPMLLLAELLKHERWGQAHFSPCSLLPLHTLPPLPRGPPPSHLVLTDVVDGLDEVRGQLVWPPHQGQLGPHPEAGPNHLDLKLLQERKGVPRTPGAIMS